MQQLDELCGRDKLQKGGRLRGGFLGADLFDGQGKSQWLFGNGGEGIFSLMTHVGECRINSEVHKPDHYFTMLHERRRSHEL